MAKIAVWARCAVVLGTVTAVVGCDISPRVIASRPMVASNEQGGGAFKAPESWAFPPGSLQPVLADGGMVSTTDRVATEIGVEILRRGGSAVDAAVATHFALAVVNPEAGNIGGGGFLVLRLATGETAALDFRETAPRAATRDMFLDDEGNVTDASTSGHRSTGVPGSVVGMWEAHRRYGTLRWEDLVQPAVHLAQGIVVHERLALSLQGFADRLAVNPVTAAIFLPQGSPPRVGDRLVQPDLADTLVRIAKEGAAGFYHGKTALLLEQEMRRGGGLITREDLADYQAVWREPIVFEYRDHQVISMPPPSSGGVTLAELLNILEGYPLRELEYQSAAHIHQWVEAAKRAYADRNAYLADPDFVEQPIERLISDDYASQRRAGISSVRATPAIEVKPGLEAEPIGPRSTDPLLEPVAVPDRESEHTTHYSIVDRRGNAVAVTTTINSLYGNGITVEGAGFLLNNEMDDFTSKPGEPNQFGLVQGRANAIEPGKRMLSAMSPTIVVDSEKRLKLVTGTPGGSTIITSVAQAISNIVDFEMSVADMTAAPRIHHQHLPDLLWYGRGGLAAGTVQSLQQLGHRVQEREGFQGDLQSIEIDVDGTAAGIADPRRGGAASGLRAPRDVVQ